MTDSPNSPRVYACEDCDWTGPTDNMAPIADVHERVLPGEFMAAGCCPECGSLIGVHDDDVPQYTLESAEIIMAKRGLGAGADLASAVSLLLCDAPSDEARARCRAALTAWRSLATRR